jgi:hypothetical protein
VADARVPARRRRRIRRREPAMKCLLGCVTASDSDLESGSAALLPATVSRASADRVPPGAGSRRRGRPTALDGRRVLSRLRGPAGPCRAGLAPPRQRRRPRRWQSIGPVTASQAAAASHYAPAFEVLLRCHTRGHTFAAMPYNRADRQQPCCLATLFHDPPCGHLRSDGSPAGPLGSIVPLALIP